MVRVTDVVYYLYNIQELRSIVQWYFAMFRASSTALADAPLGRYGMNPFISETKTRNLRHPEYASTFWTKPAAVSAR